MGLPQIPLILAGASLSVASAMAAGRLVAPSIPLPRSVRFITGAAAYSLSAFALLACHLSYPVVYVLWAGVLATAAWQRARCTHPLNGPSLGYRLLFAAAGTLYLIVAFAPEIQEDAAGYHLRIVSDYSRLHAFSGRVTFYDVLPHGLEMLFVPAFSIGAHSAARLVHFAFLIAIVPLIREIARELHMTEGSGTTAAALLFLAPVCGVAGTAAYTDMGLLCGCCAVLYLLIRWKRERLPGLLLCAGLCAGFCFSIKPVFAWIAVPATIFVAAESLPAAIRFSGAASLIPVPWLTRAWLLTGNPFAPLLNAWFPNAASTPAIEHHLFEMYSAFRPEFSWARALAAYSVTGGHQGLLGPAFLLLPLALSALYRRTGRRLLACSILMAVPFLANTGTRFVLPALVPATLALTSVLPAPVLAAAVAVQAAAAAPPLLSRYAPPGEWTLRDVPLNAALRIEPEREYLNRTLPRYAVGAMIVRNTPPDAKIFACAPLPESYIPRQILLFWHSALASRMTDALQFAAISHGANARLLSLRAELKRAPFLRLTAPSELRIVEGPNSRWQPLAEGQALIFPLNRPAPAADLLLWPADVTPTLEAPTASGAWQRVDASIDRTDCCIDLRRDVTAWMRRAGYGYILIPVAGDAFAPMGNDMALHPDKWGLETLDRSGDFWLFRISSYTA